MLASDLLELAVDGAVSAGSLLLDRFGGERRGVQSKATPTDLVSDADRESEDLLYRFIRTHRPDDGIVGEEGTGAESRSGLRWILDPLDGTVNFLFRIPVWSVSVAVEDDAGALVGVVHDPNRDETFTAVRGGGARLGTDPIRVSARGDLETALIGTGFAYDARIRAHQAEVVRRVLPRVRDVRRAGSAALDLASLACGRLDGFYEAHMEIWDRAAGVLIVSEAGGVISDYPPPHGDAVGVIGANPVLHPQLEALVNEEVS